VHDDVRVIRREHLSTLACAVLGARFLAHGISPLVSLFLRDVLRADAGCGQQTRVVGLDTNGCHGMWMLL
jgi:hypothetical protein